MLNRVVLVGRLTKDPDFKMTPSGVPVATFTLAVNRTFTNQQGEREADFIQCVVWRRQAENVSQYLHKGSLAGVDGRLQTRNYEGQDGKRVYVTEVVADNVQFLEPKGTSNRNTGYDNNDSFPPFNTYQNEPKPYTKIDDDPFAKSGQTIDISEDDLPF